MRKRHILALAGCLLWGGMAGMAHAGTTYFDVTDVPGRWFDRGAANNIAGTQSLAIVPPYTKIKFLQKSSKYGPLGNNGPSRVESRHTVTSLIWPSTADLTGRDKEVIDQSEASQDDQEVTLRTPGLHVFVCKVHPYMLGAVIVDTDGAQPFDIGQKLHLLGTTKPADPSTAFPSYSDLAVRLLRAFFVITNPDNWKDYTKTTYWPDYPNVDIAVYDKDNTLIVANLRDTLRTPAPVAIPPVQKPAFSGVGEVWVDTQYELSARKGEAYPGTITVVDVEGMGNNAWKVKQKIALPRQKMNNGHNMWASHDQKQIYQTEWHGKSLFVIDRVYGQFLKEIEVGHDPAHVMTRVDTEQVHVTLNGEDSVVELNPAHPPAYLKINSHRPGGLGRIPMQHPGEDQAQPHAHWMGFDGKTMTTPNSNTADSTLYDFERDTIVSKLETGALPIAAAMMPDSSKYYVSNYLGNTTSVIDMTTNPPTKIKDINLLLGAITGMPTGLPTMIRSAGSAAL